MKIGKEVIGSRTFGECFVAEYHKIKVVVKEMKKMEWFQGKNQTAEIFLYLSSTLEYIHSKWYLNDDSK